MRISDWSSDVCSSDLHQHARAVVDLVPRHVAGEFRGQRHRGHACGQQQQRHDHGARRPPGGAHQVRGQQHRRHDQCHRSEEHTSELQSLMRISYAVFCLKKKTTTPHSPHTPTTHHLPPPHPPHHTPPPPHSPTHLPH